MAHASPQRAACDDRDHAVRSVALADPAPPTDVAPSTRQRVATRLRPVGWVAFGLLIAAGTVARWWPRSALWLDEAQSVTFARLPLRSIPFALRRDGAPPLYYLVLHVWMGVFGSGDVAVRSLSVACSLATLPILFVAVRRVISTRAALVAVVIMATSPFAIRYASETRMYALVMLEVTIGLLVLHAALDRPSAPRILGVTICTAALLYTHYWSIYLVAVVAGGLLLADIGGRRRPERSAIRRCVVAMIAGALLWLPWVPTFLFQLRHTGTPWYRTAPGAAVVAAAHDGDPWRRWLGVVIAADIVVLILAALAAAIRRRPRSWRRPECVLAATLVSCSALALLGAALSHSATAARYTAIVYPLTVALAAAGAVAFRVGTRSVMVAVLALGGLVLAGGEVRQPRTRAAAVVAALLARASVDDIVVYCPDQLAPAISRLLHQSPLSAIRQRVYPEVSTPEAVNWIDYAKRYDAADPSAFVDAVDQEQGGSVVWLVVSRTSPPTQQACRRLLSAFNVIRPTGYEVIAEDPSIADPDSLWELPPSAPASGSLATSSVRS